MGSRSDLERLHWTKEIRYAIATYASPAGAYLRAELYVGGLHLATYANATTYFSHTDWTGTERVRSAMNGTASETCMDLPRVAHSSVFCLSGRQE